MKKNALKFEIINSSFKSSAGSNMRLILWSSLMSNMEQSLALSIEDSLYTYLGRNLASNIKKSLEEKRRRQ
jgi:hypothetical protein